METKEWTISGMPEGLLVKFMGLEIVITVFDIPEALTFCMFAKTTCCPCNNFGAYNSSKDNRVIVLLIIVFDVQDKVFFIR